MGFDGVSPYQNPPPNRGPPYRYLPADVVDTPLEWPLGYVLHKAFADWIFSHVLPFFRIALAVAKAVVKRMRLPAPIVMIVQFPELPFPISHPIVKGIFQVMWRGEEMNVIGHHNVIAHEPFRCRTPDLLKPRMHEFVRQPRDSIGRAKGRPHNVRFSEANVHAASRSSAARFLEWVIGHGCVGRARLQSSPEIQVRTDPGEEVSRVRRESHPTGLELNYSFARSISSLSSGSNRPLAASSIYLFAFALSPLAASIRP